MQSVSIVCQQVKHINRLIMPIRVWIGRLKSIGRFKARQRTVIAWWLALLPQLGACLTFPLPENGDDVIGDQRIIITAYTDTFADLALKEGVGFLALIAANPKVDAWVPGEGTEVVLPTQMILPPGPRKGVVINLAELRLYYYPPNDPVVMVYPIGIGRKGWETPLGKTRITQKKPNPSWRPPESIRQERAMKGEFLPDVIPPGPNNPLGKFALRLGFRGSYLIHGTNLDFGVGMRVSHGCIRLFPDDIEELFYWVDRGTPVRVIHEPYKIGKLNGEFYVEAHEPLSEKKQHHQAAPYRALESWFEVIDAQKATVDQRKILDVLTEQQGMPVKVSADLKTSATKVNHTSPHP
ncbi:L,D-transpeptidase family protein [Spartinivicinus poritis]|uniref:L,D-transpeptidase family protein n=1 Tax=Spartinivicinus poritis TaxID=2994640 RepID=A0ABT5UFW4_9GAMM|nr:L,D-transpeptidase family protein [Spartinivicinus sp. A2-2]MDE1464881.1 L,D-transpeptidase family protein [Spartinivicinus sp. A2-2]